VIGGGQDHPIYIYIYILDFLRNSFYSSRNNTLSFLEE